MAKIKDYRERVHQPFFDSLVRGIGQTTIANQFQLFGSANVGNPDKTNLQVPGVLASDQTYICKAVRCLMYFQSLNDAEFNLAFSPLSAITGPVGTQSRAQDLYSLCGYGAYFTLNVGNKPMLNGPLWYTPAGGGISGTSNQNARHIIQNGMATQEAILKLAKDIHVPARQNFNIVVNFFPFAVLGVASGGATISGPVDVLGELNAFDGIKVLQYHLDGILTRDVQ